MKTGKPLPKRLPGTVVPQYRTVNGKTYGPYWFRCWRESGRLRKRYVRPPELEEVRAACDAHRERRRAETLARKAVRRELSDLAFLWRVFARVERHGEAATASPEEIDRLTAALARRTQG